MQTVLLDSIMRPTRSMAIPAVTGVQLALVAPEIPSVPFTIGGDMPDYPQDAVMILDGYDRSALQAATPAIADWLAASPLAGSDSVWTSYGLGYIIDQADLLDIVVAPQQSMP